MALYTQVKCEMGRVSVRLVDRAPCPASFRTGRARSVGSESEERFLFFFFFLVCVHVRKVHANCGGNVYVDLEIHNDGEIVVTQSNTKQEAGNLLLE